MSEKRKCTKCGAVGRKHHIHRDGERGPWCEACVAVKSARWHGKLRDRTPEQRDEVRAAHPMCRCSRCKDTLPRSDFRENWSQPTGAFSYCKPCQNDYQNERRARLRGGR